MKPPLEIKLALLLATLEKLRAQREAERAKQEDRKLAVLRAWWLDAAQ